MENGIAFVLLGFPLYLLYKGTLGTYFGFASKSGACSGSTSGSGVLKYSVNNPAVIVVTPSN
jgi:hypothetical protein